jgi:hypothetical protein
MLNHLAPLGHYHDIVADQRIAHACLAEQGTSQWLDALGADLASQPDG